MTRLLARAESDGDKGDSPEKLFQKELQRRGLPTSEQENRSTGKTSTSQAAPPPNVADVEKLRSQLEESRKLNSEGLEGLIPRAKQLLTLGVTFFLAFTPVIIAISLLFGGISWLYGDQFIHGGRPSFTPYIDPAELLSEPTVDERIPF